MVSKHKFTVYRNVSQFTTMCQRKVYIWGFYTLDNNKNTVKKMQTSKKCWKVKDDSMYTITKHNNIT